MTGEVRSEMDTAVDRNPFWIFSLAVYQQPGIPEACLYAQDRFDVDVNVLLFAVWHVASHDRVPEPSLMADAARVSASWRSRVVAPLRTIRRAMKDGIAGWDAPEVEACRDRVKVLELAAERKQQDRLARLAPLPRGHEDAADLCPGELADPAMALGQAIDGVVPVPDDLSWAAHRHRLIAVVCDWMRSNRTRPE